MACYIHWCVLSSNPWCQLVDHCIRTLSAHWNLCCPCKATISPLSARGRVFILDSFWSHTTTCWSYLPAYSYLHYLPSVLQCSRFWLRCFWVVVELDPRQQLLVHVSWWLCRYHGCTITTKEQYLTEWHFSICGFSSLGAPSNHQSMAQYTAYNIQWPAIHISTMICISNISVNVTSINRQLLQLLLVLFLSQFHPSLQNFKKNRKQHLCKTWKLHQHLFNLRLKLLLQKMK